MPRYPDAKWRPVSGHTDGPMRAHLGWVLHVNQSVGNLYNWVAGDHGMSCHFEVYRDGSIEQYLDTADSSWAQKDGNSTYLSIETEGYGVGTKGHPATQLTGAQCEAIAGLLKWGEQVHGIPLRTCEVPGQRGFGWHGMGAAHGYDWGHAACPGELRKDQRQHIIDIAKGEPMISIKDITKGAKAAIVGPDGKPHRVDTVVWFMHKMRTTTDTGKHRNQTPAWYLVRAYANALTGAHRAGHNGVRLDAIDRKLRAIQSAQVDPAELANAVVAALPPATKGGLTASQIEQAVRAALDGATIQTQED